MAVNWIGLLVGAAAGAALGLVTRCPGNTCPLTSNCWIPTILGGLVGLMWGG